MNEPISISNILVGKGLFYGNRPLDIFTEFQNPISNPNHIPKEWCDYIAIYEDNSGFAKDVMKYNTKPFVAVTKAYPLKVNNDVFRDASILLLYGSQVDFVDISYFIGNHNAIGIVLYDDRVEYLLETAMRNMYSKGLSMAIVYGMDMNKYRFYEEFNVFGYDVFKNNKFCCQ